MQPVTGSHESLVQALPSSHPVGPPGVQAPPLQTSPVVQALWSSQGAELFVWVHPVAGSHESSVQMLPSSHPGADPPWHDPPLQTSPVVQAVPSSHGAELLVCSQPWDGSQTSSVQMLLSSQAVLSGA